MGEGEGVEKEKRDVKEDGLKLRKERGDVNSGQWKRGKEAGRSRAG